MNSHIHRQPNAFEQFQSHFLVDLVVFHQQYSGAFTHTYIFGDNHFKRHDIAAFQSGGKPERAALIGNADNPRIPTHHQSQPFGNGKPQPGAAVFARGRTLRLFEGFKYPFLTFLSDAYPGVLHFKAQHDRIVHFRHQQNA